ncbi:hypothetical protein [Nocardiopsis deserti]|uniref:hypothetical protein n=1 Tax=Nocardiopsis deserti TaxID=2605988 RepID=UPI0012396B63|nr:hypothetical protein [Nocardiopsis deserti]
MRRNEALDALERAETVGTRVRSRGGWYMVFSALFAASTFGLTVVIGLFPSPVSLVAATTGFMVILTALLVFAARQPVSPRRFGALHGLAVFGWATVYGVTLFVGIRFFPGDPVWWVSGAALGAVPPLVAGWLAIRKGRSA